MRIRIVGCLCSLLVAARALAGDSGPRHVVCHTGGDGPETLTVGQSELSSHRRHGDTMGPCSPLTETLIVESGVVIDCEGGTLVPAAPGEGTLEDLDDRRAGCARSEPPLAILFDGADGSVLRNCQLDGFFNGVLVFGGGDNLVEHNTIRANDSAVVLTMTHENTVRENLVGFGGLGIDADRDADRNAILHNEIVYDPSLGGPTRAGIGVLVQDNPAAVTYWVVEGRLLLARRGNTEDNEVTGNRIRGAEVGIYNATGSHRTRITGNDIEDSIFGIRLPGFPAQFGAFVAGSCTKNLRPCNDDSECFIEGYDAAPNGVCEPPEENTRCWISGQPCHNVQNCRGDDFPYCGVFVPTDDIRVVRPRVEDNVVTGIWYEGAEGESVGIGAWHTLDAEIRGNHVQDNQVSLVVSEESLHAAVVEHNTFADGYLGLVLLDLGVLLGWGTDPLDFGATIRLNDFVGNVHAYEAWLGVDAELSRMEQGNHWGLTCEQGVFGFPADPAFPRATDSLAFGVPVANLSPLELEQVTPCSLTPE